MATNGDGTIKFRRRRKGNEFMKTKRKKSKPALTASISEERILQLSNDLSEDIASGSTAEWRSVALYFRKELDRAYNDLNAIRPTVAAMTAGLNMIAFAKAEMNQWINRVKS